MPVAVAATRYSRSYELLHAAFAIPVGMFLGLGAVWLARTARTRDELTLGRAGGARAARLGRLLGIAGFCLATTAVIAVAVYGLLEYVGTRD